MKTLRHIIKRAFLIFRRPRVWKKAINADGTAYLYLNNRARLPKGWVWVDGECSMIQSIGDFFSRMYIIILLAFFALILSLSIDYDDTPEPPKDDTTIKMDGLW